MKLLVLNIGLALAVGGYVTWGVLHLRHDEACIYRALTIIDAANHHVSGTTLDMLRADFDEQC